MNLVQKQNNIEGPLDELLAHYKTDKKKGYSFNCYSPGRFIGDISLFIDTLLVGRGNCRGYELPYREGWYPWPQEVAQRIWDTWGAERDYLIDRADPLGRNRILFDGRWSVNAYAIKCAFTFFRRRKTAHYRVRRSDHALKIKIWQKSDETWPTGFMIRLRDETLPKYEGADD